LHKSESAGWGSYIYAKQHSVAIRLKEQN